MEPSVQVELELLTADEVRTGLAALTKQEHVRLYKAATALSYGTGDAAQEIVNDAVCALLEGVRRTRRDMTFVSTLIGVMKSRTWWARQQLKDAPESLEVIDPDNQRLADPGRLPDELLLAKEDFEQRQNVLNVVFDGDDTAQLILIGQYDGMTAADIRDQIGLSKKEYATVLRRIRRKMEPAIREGWPK